MAMIPPRRWNFSISAKLRSIECSRTRNRPAVSGLLKDQESCSLAEMAAILSPPSTIFKGGAFSMRKSVFVILCLLVCTGVGFAQQLQQVLYLPEIVSGQQAAG